MSSYHLAQVNLAKAKYELTHSRMKEFVDALASINSLAEKSPGFVWRLKDDHNDNALAFKAFGDSKIIINLSLWDSIENLKNFVFQTNHFSIMKRKTEWFEHPRNLPTPYLAMWWIKKGEIPTLAEAKDKLISLEKNGPTSESFTFRESFPPQ